LLAQPQSKCLLLFRKESYTIGDLTLVALIGDEKESVALVDDDGGGGINVNYNSWPRCRFRTENVSDNFYIPRVLDKLLFQKCSQIPR
jgi:hypothetical protein